ncbi:RcgA family putative transporter [Sulfitobacter sp. G21635-S1]|uniref:RcgA family putative transporter n=1 Tax=Sulfitobacter sp. G21635-S1 TaxID=3014043 RepID=UPI003FCEE369
MAKPVVRRRENWLDPAHSHFPLWLYFHRKQTHDTIRSRTKQNEARACRLLIKNGKFFLPPQGDRSDLKKLFKRLASAGVGRPMDEDGFPSGPWTPELLADAISQIEANPTGIDLRTVQLWFQENDKGISTDNIRWLARIFGCEDPQATSEWQAELSAAQSRLAARRREKRRSSKRDVQETLKPAWSAPSDRKMEPPAAIAQNINVTTPRHNFSLAASSAAIFSRKSQLDLPVLVFAGAVGLGFFAYMLDIHSVLIGPAEGSIRQVGFLWAPNWTVLFLVVLPLYLALVVEVLTYWKQAVRLKLVAKGNRATGWDAGAAEESDKNWRLKTESFSSSYWASFLICLPVAAVFQWIDRCLSPLLTGDLGNYAVEWARLAIVRPDVISVPEAIVFTGIAYLYMGLCFFLFFAGLILLCTLAYDFWEIGRESELGAQLGGQSEAQDIGHKIMRGIFRCSVLGLLIAICMKLQSTFMLSGEKTIVNWLVNDFLSIFGAHQGERDWLDYSMPTNFSSLLIVLATCAAFLYGSLRIQAVLARLPSSDLIHKGNTVRKGNAGQNEPNLPWPKMTAVVTMLVVNYLLIGVLVGFSVFLGLGLVLAIYSLFNPELRRRGVC